MSKKNDKRAAVLVLGGGIAEQVSTAGGKHLYVGYADKAAINMVAKADAVILTGGVDINPRIYGQSAGKSTQHPNDARDNVEVRVLKAAFDKGIPVLGICRGSQMINAAFGGTLHQEIHSLPNTHRYHLGHDHRVELLKGSRVRNALRKAEAWVTSIHHQAVDKVAPGFRVTAVAKDGTVEAVEVINPERWIVGVQFHPEIGTNEMLQGVFNALVKEAARVAGLPEPTPSKVKPKRVWAMPSKPVKKIANPITAAEVEAGRRARMDTSVLSPTGRLVSWQCFRCGISFDDRMDHLDHMWFIHDVDLLDNLEDREINAILYKGEKE